ncbi:unnamed protein product [Effrenium voratum]|nr:unnamed protein product [Effrenium voratum]
MRRPWLLLALLWVGSRTFSAPRHLGPLPERVTDKTLNDFAEKGDVEAALSALQKLLTGEESLQHKRYLYNTAIKACANAGDIPQAESLLNKMLETRVQPNLKGLGKMMEATAKVGNISGAEYWFRRRRHFGIEEVSTQDYNQLISAAAKAQDMTAVEKWFQELLDQGEASPVTLLAILEATARQGDLRLAQQWCDRWQSLGLELSFGHRLALLNNFAKAGDLEGAERLMAELPEKAEVAYHTVMDAASRCGNLTAAEFWFREAEAAGFNPSLFVARPLAPRGSPCAMELAFVAPATGAAGASTPALRAAAASASAPSDFGRAAGLGLGVMALAAAGASRKTARKAQEMAKLPKHMQPVDDTAKYPVYAPGPSGVPKLPQLVGDWPVPLPGSYKACLTMVGPDVETACEVGKPWDPLGLSKLYDRNFDFNGNMTYPHVQWLRESELKHGRCAMLAIVGIFAQQSFHIDGYPEAPWYEALKTCYDNPAGIVGFGIAQISAFAMVIEGAYFPKDSWVGQMDREPGDLGFDPLKLAKDAESMKSMQLKELKMDSVGFIGITPDPNGISCWALETNRFSQLVS